MKNMIICVGSCLCTLLSPNVLASNVLESFKVTTQNVEVRESTETSLQFRSDTNAYFIKLEPNKQGRVIFALSGIGYASTAKVSNLAFGVEITGYYNDRIVTPTFSIDDINRDIVIERNTLKFQQIYGSLPVWFDQQVDSVNLRFRNSMDLNVNQYLGIQDLRIVPLAETAPNPQVVPCGEQTVMIGLDGSSSVVRRERAMIAKQLKDLVRKSMASPDTNAICLMEFGSHVLNVVESEEKKVLKQAINRYKKDKNHEGECTKYTNWSAAFDEAIKRKPDIFIFITDGWSNWSDHGPASLSAQFETLLIKSNTIKSNGTRLLFVASDMDTHDDLKSNLKLFLNGEYTFELGEGQLSSQVNLNDVDLVTMRHFSKMQELNLASIFECPDEIVEVMRD